jgi:hypothetical protein
LKRNNKDLLDNYKALASLVDRIEKRPRIAAWLKSRPGKIYSIDPFRYAAFQFSVDLIHFRLPLIPESPF